MLVTVMHEFLLNYDLTLTLIQLFMFSELQITATANAHTSRLQSTCSD